MGTLRLAHLPERSRRTILVEWGAGSFRAVLKCTAIMHHVAVSPDTPRRRRLLFHGHLADRSSCLLVNQIECLREAYRTVQQRRPFETIVVCVLPDHIHALWALPDGDADFSTRWSLIKNYFSRDQETRSRSISKIRKRETMAQERHSLGVW